MKNRFESLAEQWNKDRLNFSLSVCWLLTVAASFFGSCLLPISITSSFTLFPFRVLLPITMVLYLIRAIKTKESFWSGVSPLEKWCYVFIAVMILYGIVSLFRAINRLWSASELFNLTLDMCFFFLLLRLCRDREMRKKTLYVSAALFLLLLLLGIYEVFFGGICNHYYDNPRWHYFTLLNREFQQPVVFSANTNDYALHIAFLFALAGLCLLRPNCNLPKKASAVLVPLGAAVYFLLVGTSSRLCIIAFYLLLAGLFVYAFLREPRRWLKIPLALVVCILGIYFVYQYHSIVPAVRKYVIQMQTYQEEIQKSSSAPASSAPASSAPASSAPASSAPASSAPASSAPASSAPASSAPASSAPASSAPASSAPEKPHLDINDPLVNSIGNELTTTDPSTGSTVLNSSASVGARLILIRHCLRCFTDSHGLGVGLGNTEMLAKEGKIAYQGKIYSIHCFLARIIGDYGIFILIPMLMILFYLLKNLIAALKAAVQNKDRAVTAYSVFCMFALLCYPIISTASSDAQDKLSMWLFLAMLVLFSVILPPAEKRPEAPNA